MALDTGDPEFDHHSRFHAEHWREVFRSARERGCPVLHSSSYGGYDVLTRHADVLAASNDWKHFSSERSWSADGSDDGLGTAIPPRIMRVGFLDMDPPRSLAFRRCVNRWFTRGSINRGKDRITEIADWAIDQVIERGGCDLVSELATPFQRTVLFDLLGLPADQWRADTDQIISEFRSENEAAHDRTASDARAERAAFYGWVAPRALEEILHQRAHGGPGMIADLVRAEVGGEPIDPETCAELVTMIIGGGEETTVAAIVTMLRFLAENPEEKQRLLNDRDLLPTAVDEIIRFTTPAMGNARTVMEPCEISGTSFEPGDRVLLAYASANYDTAVFGDPEVVRLDRNPNPHLAFGAGVHRCIGAIFAQINIECLVMRFIERISQFHIIDGRIRPAYEEIGKINSYYSLPIEFPPGRRLGPLSAAPVLTRPRIRPNVSAMSATDASLSRS
jgi:cytochrome P450